MKIGFIGAGRAGTALAVALSRAGYDVATVADVDVEASKGLASLLPGCTSTTDNQIVADTADLVFLTVPDDRIADVAAELAWRPDQAVVHCSGAATLDILAPAAERGASIGSFHPLQSFADLDRALASIPGTTFAIEAEGSLLATLSTMAEALGGRWIELKPDQRMLYHAAAVFAGNYPVTLISLAARLWRELGFAEDEARRALLPLIRGAVENMEAGDLAAALTGPIARGDTGTVVAHLEALGLSAPDLVPVYCELGRLTIRMAVSAGKLNEKESAGMLSLFNEH
jgi:predicted short-subunit dehydrogenase-like oxidoreductase (DUF2520 family)